MNGGVHTGEAYLRLEIVIQELGVLARIALVHAIHSTPEQRGQ